MANNDEPDGPPSGPRETLGKAPHPVGDGGTGPAPIEATGGTPTPAPGGLPPKQASGGVPKPASSASGGRNVPLLVGIGVVIVAIIAVIIGIAH